MQQTIISPIVLILDEHFAAAVLTDELSGSLRNRHLKLHKHGIPSRNFLEINRVFIPYKKYNKKAGHLQSFSLTNAGF